MPRSRRHDESYRQIFGDRHMMAELVRGFFPADWTEDWDLSSLERKDTQWVSERLGSRRGDLIWRVRRRSRGEAGQPDEAPDQWVYLYVLLEFQSRPDWRMALRLNTYLSLFLHAPLDAREIPPQGPYPVVLPVVLYNGRRPWQGGTSLQERQLHMPEVLQPFNPALRFLLIDLHTLPAATLKQVANACSVFFQLERIEHPEALSGLVARLAELLPHDDHAALRRTLVAWIEHVLLPAHSSRIEAGFSLPSSLSEVSTMLAERVKDWFADARARGLREGREEGLQEGRQEGLQIGQQEGRLQGQAEILHILLQDRFGPTLPAWVDGRLAKAEDHDLRRWAQAVLRAETLEAVFDLR